MSSRPVIYHRENRSFVDPVYESIQKSKKDFQVMGGMEIFLAIISTVIGVILLSLKSSYLDPYAYIGAGIWTGCMFFVEGYLVILTAKKKTQFWVYTTLVASIFTVVASTAMIALEFFAFLYLEKIRDLDLNVNLGLHSILIGLGYANFLTFLGVFHLCFVNVCCLDVSSSRVVRAAAVAYAYPDDTGEHRVPKEDSLPSYDIALATSLPAYQPDTVEDLPPTDSSPPPYAES